MYELIDDEKILFVGTETEMQLAYFILAWDEKTLHRTFQEERLAQLKEKYRVPHKGKIKMVPHAKHNREHYKGGQEED